MNTYPGSLRVPTCNGSLTAALKNKFGVVATVEIEEAFDKRAHVDLSLAELAALHAGLGEILAYARNT